MVVCACGFQKMNKTINALRDIRYNIINSVNITALI